jgi:hypothetical protein
VKNPSTDEPATSRRAGQKYLITSYTKSDRKVESAGLLGGHVTACINGPRRPAAANAIAAFLIVRIGVTVAGVGIRTIRLMLGHSDIKTIQRHLNITDEELQRGLTGVWDGAGS